MAPIDLKNKWLHAVHLRRILPYREMNLLVCFLLSQSAEDVIAYASRFESSRWLKILELEEYSASLIWNVFQSCITASGASNAQQHRGRKQRLTNLLRLIECEIRSEGFDLWLTTIIFHLGVVARSSFLTSYSGNVKCQRKPSRRWERVKRKWKDNGAVSQNNFAHSMDTLAPHGESPYSQLLPRIGSNILTCNHGWRSWVTYPIAWLSPCGCFEFWPWLNFQTPA